MSTKTNMSASDAGESGIYLLWRATQPKRELKMKTLKLILDKMHIRTASIVV